MKVKTFRSRRSRLKRYKKQKNKRPFSWKKFFLILISIGIVGILGLALYTAYALPSVKDADQLAFSESTIIYDRAALDPSEDPNQHILYVIHGEENRDYVPLKDIPQHVKDATLAIEDDNFYNHPGFDIFGIAKAALNYIFDIGSTRGGSTITQQLVKNTFLSPEKTLMRKFNEILLAIKVELNYSKDEILELYLNNIPYGSNAHGIEAAAKTFFDKSATELTIGESAILSSLPNRPTTYSPYGPNKNLLMGYYKTLENGEKEYKKGRKDLVLERMLDLEMIKYEQFENAWIETNNIEFRKAKIDIKAPHFVFYVRQQIEEKFGKELLKKGGLRVYTTLDPTLQKIAEDTIATRSAAFEEKFNAKNAALASINPANGELLAYVGGKNYFDEENDGQVDVLTSRRQPGSSFKPFTYAAAFEKGYSPSTVVFDVETDFGGNYQPQNFDGVFMGPVAMRDALNRSLNIPAIKAAYLGTPAGVIKLARKAGIVLEGDAEQHGVAIGIGVAEVEPLSLISAYQIFTNDGTYYQPQAILEIHNSEGVLLEKYNPEKNFRKAIDGEIAGLVRHMLTDETSRPTTGEGEEAFDWNTYLQLKDLNNGAKTGTSNRVIENPDFDEEQPEDEDENPRFITVPNDSWTIGFTPYLVTGVWVGNNTGEPMKLGGTGMMVAAPIWRDFMNKGHETLYEQGSEKGKLYTESKPLEVRKINKFSGKIATELTPEKLSKEEVFASFNVPIELDDSVKEIEIDRRTGTPATARTPFYARQKTKALTGLTSLKPDMPNWQAPVEEWIQNHPKFITSLGDIMDNIDEDRPRILTQRERQERTEIFRTRNTTPKEIISDPVIKIQSPKDNGSVSPGIIEIQVAAFATQGVAKVEYFFDKTFVTESNEFPWNTKFKIPDSINKNVSHTITVIVTDKKGQSNEDEVEIKLEADTIGPQITFLGPVGNQDIINGSFMHILTDVRDAQSSVRVVEFSIDDQSLGFADQYPFEVYFSEKVEPGRHMIRAKAWDLQGNVSEKSIPVQFVREKIIHHKTPSIDRITPYGMSLSVNIIIPDPEKTEWVELVGEQNDEIVYSKKISPTSKFAQFQIKKRFIGQTQLRLVSKMKNKDEADATAPRVIEL